MKKSFISLLIASISVIFLSGFVFFSSWSVSPTSYYFADVPWGESRDAQFTVYNNDSVHSGGGTVSISADAPEAWSCVSGCSYWIGPQEEHTVTIRYNAYQAPSPWGANGGATIHFPTTSGTINGFIGVSVTGMQ